MRCRRRSGWAAFSAGNLALASCTRFSPNTVCPAANAVSTAAAGWVLLTATRVTACASRPASLAAAAIFARTSRRFPANAVCPVFGIAPFHIVPSEIAAPLHLGGSVPLDAPHPLALQHALPAPGPSAPAEPSAV